MGEELSGRGIFSDKKEGCRPVGGGTPRRWDYPHPLRYRVWRRRVWERFGLVARSLASPRLAVVEKRQPLHFLLIRRLRALAEALCVSDGQACSWAWTTCHTRRVWLLALDSTLDKLEKEGRKGRGDSSMYHLRE